MVHIQAAAVMNTIPDTVYLLSKFVVIPGWLILIASLFVRRVRPIGWPTAQFVLPAILALGYLFMVWEGRHGFDSYGLLTFFRLDGIDHLYNDRSALTASWLHFLALDLFAGAWIVRDGVARLIHPLLILLCLPFTLMLAALGLLLYFALRLATGSGRGAETPA